MPFHMSKIEALNIVLTYKEQVVPSYIYIDVVFSRLSIHIIPIVEAVLSKGYATIATSKRQCFQLQFQDIWTKIHLFHILVATSIIYNWELWGPYLRQTRRSHIERVLTKLFYKHNHMKKTIPHVIIIAKFGSQPLLT